MGSRGSIIPFFLSLKDQDEIPITDKLMTRFMISLDQCYASTSLGCRPERTLGSAKDLNVIKSLTLRT